MSVAEWLGIIVSCLAVLVMAFGGIGRLLITQIDRRLDERFETLEERRKEGQEAWQALFAEHIRHDERELGAINTSVSALASDLYRNYVRKEDMRGMTGKDLDEKIDLIIRAISESRNDDD